MITTRHKLTRYSGSLAVVLGVEVAQVFNCGVTFLPGDHLYADSTGIIMSPDALDIE